MQIEGETDLNNSQNVAIENQPSAETNCIFGCPGKIETNQPLSNDNPKSDKVEEFILKSKENKQSIRETENNIQQIQKLIEYDFQLSSELSEKIEITKKHENSNKDIENDKKIEISEIKLPDNNGITKLLIKLPKSFSSYQFIILDGENRCYDNTHMQLVEQYF